MTQEKRTFVLDTNVLMHDPTSLFRFDEHDVFIPMIVLEELDAAKKGMSEVSRNARQVSRFINELIESDGVDDIRDGVPLLMPGGLNLHQTSATGRLYFQTEPPGNGAGARSAADNLILASILDLREAKPDQPVVLVSKDINLRIKATIYGVSAEDYENDRALDDFSLLYTGLRELPDDFWTRHEKQLRSWTERGHTFYEMGMGEQDDWQPNQFLYLPGDDEVELRVLRVEGGSAVLQIIDDYRSGGHSVWGVTARNREQNFALNALMDPEVDFVTLLGTAGTGKTLLAL
ncbi:MAG TPA: PIN domain-containing protein, partial [Xanthomonadaceae bacterium]|nr:PIN domain-containing protein [Xanthomonadaceae bacterium]